ncbi:protein translocase subunit SecD [Pseudoalteromonas sp. BDTF-M6]|uniref:protein translocase subunit SecD n=1 Tax=Pseudoalteromonas sp. BDTF-M6 TaxID=2796132 RepID=UPI001BB07021|nr:protein translocase subunit SecD [Pseudoalteromonas sp. BDTF-M6]MBS3796888.1 protein translocase subunit SecD [Pseudoalteromonas sp. BDTF-M6]
MNNKNGSLWRAKRGMGVFTTLVLIVILALSALPNLYPNTKVIAVENPEGAQALVQTERLLDSQGFPVQGGHFDPQAQRLLLTLERPNNSAAAAGVLRQQLMDADVKVQTRATTPSWMQSLGLAPMKLGLDLGGGVLFVLQVDTDQAMAQRIESIAADANTLRRTHGLRGVSIDTGDHALVLRSPLRSAAQGEQLQDQLQQLYPQLHVTREQKGDFVYNRLHYPAAQQQLFAREDMAQALATLRKRIEELGITEAVVQRQGEQGIRIELPGVQDPGEAKRIIGATAQLSFHGLQQQGGKRVLTQEGDRVAIDAKAIFTGNDITGAQAGRDEWGQPMVQLQLSSQGGDKINRFSRAQIGEPMATLYSEYVQGADENVHKREEVISIATINEALGTRFSITGLGSWQRAQDLALVLRAGSLEAPIRIIKEQTMSPSLGEQNISNGLNALLLGFALTLGFMLFWYRRLGVVANLALMVNVVSLLGLMSLLPGVVLTLPGIAGLVLTIGMAVDTNVIIFERIKEELRLGRTRLQALQRGYQHAMSSIIDANLTTFISALVLVGVGYGPVKGFAITLALGIATSVFSGVLVSKYLSYLLFNWAKETAKHPTKEFHYGE